MKIGIVTFFKSYNYGVWFQAYATQKFLELQGYNVEMINYSNSYEKKKTNISYKEGDRAIGYLTSLIKSILFGKVRYYNKGFRKYINDCYRLTEKEYTNVAQMSELVYDVLVVGSDQVWNPQITNGLDKVFLLQFGKAGKRISIASSLGSKALPPSDKEQLIHALESFNGISVREEFAREYLQNESSKTIKVLCDPTFLLTRNQWIESVAKKSEYYNIKDKYILTYFVSNEKRKSTNINLIKEYSKKLNLPVWAIQFSTYFSDGVDKKILGASIFDFIALLLKAELVITDSFHGAALSANMNKDFVAIANTENPVRTQNLLSKIGLLDRINLPPDQYSDIDYSSVNEKISAIRRDSQEWIIEMIGV